MPTIVFTVEALEGVKTIRVLDMLKKEDHTLKDVRVQEKRDVQVFGSAGEGEVEIYFTCHGQAEQKHGKTHYPRRGDNFPVPGCG